MVAALSPLKPWPNPPTHPTPAAPHTYALPAPHFPPRPCQPVTLPCCRAACARSDEMYTMINKLPTVFEVVSGRVKTLDGAKKAANTARAPRPPGPESADRGPGPAPGGDDDGGDEEGDGDSDPCPQCGKLYSTNEFWIACDFCDTWYCGRCAKMTEAKAQKIKSWKCNGCSGTT
eukprot:56164-Chlamydomonas_euryale.AAC.14